MSDPEIERTWTVDEMWNIVTHDGQWPSKEAYSLSEYLAKCTRLMIKFESLRGKYSYEAWRELSIEAKDKT